jgi:hypothetical protein
MDCIHSYQFLPYRKFFDSYKMIVNTDTEQDTALIRNGERNRDKERNREREREAERERERDRRMQHIEAATLLLLQYGIMSHFFVLVSHCFGDYVCNRRRAMRKTTLLLVDGC